MRISKYYKLGRSQPTLDFVDVDVFGDAKIFVDPRALRLLPSSWGDECVSLIQNFFGVVIDAIHKQNHARARQLLRALKEPNETHLGLSKGRARGHALGRESANDVWEAFSKSEAVSSGLLEDLEDTILMVDRISFDIISDMTTNIIRQPLIEYTHAMADFYGIPLTRDVNSGPLWDPESENWFSELVPLPMTKWGKLLLVPKVIVRRSMDYDAQEYFVHYLLTYLQEFELNSNSDLVQLLKDGRRRVTKRDLIRKYGRGKSVIVQETRKHPEVLRRYRDEKRQHYQPPLDHLEIASAEGSAPPDWKNLFSALQQVQTGRESFKQYEKAIEALLSALLSALFYPSLVNPQMQRPIHEGRKVIDLTYTNAGRAGFFWWVSQHYSASHLFIECKNYDGDPGNPELDQLSGRFSPSRGQVGILTCRRLINKDLFLQRCKDTASDQRGFILALDDEDIESLVEERKHVVASPYKLLRERFEALIM
jgi:hypothetical protein